jgi:hypothetical protein
MRTDDAPGPDAGRPEPPGGHARRRLEQEMASRFGEEPDPSPDGSDDEPAGERRNGVRDPDGTGG